MKSKFNKGDCFEVKSIPYDQFLEIHQILEDCGEPLYRTTQYRKRTQGYYGNSFYNFNGSEWMLTEKYDVIKILSLEEVYQILGVDKSNSYEIY